MTKYTVRKQGRTWGIYRDNTLIEGGFFHRSYAIDACEAYQSASQDDGPTNPGERAEALAAGLDRTQSR